MRKTPLDLYVCFDRQTEELFRKKDFEDPESIFTPAENHFQQRIHRGKVLTDISLESVWMGPW